MQLHCPALVIPPFLLTFTFKTLSTDQLLQSCTKTTPIATIALSGVQ